MREKPSSESATQPVSAATEQPTPAWGQLLWDLTDPRSRRWAASVQMAAMGSTTVGSDGSMFTQMGSFSTDGSTRMGSTATGLGAVFNKPDDWPNSKADKFGMDDDNW